MKTIFIALFLFLTVIIYSEENQYIIKEQTFNIGSEISKKVEKNSLKKIKKIHKKSKSLKLPIIYISNLDGKFIDSNKDGSYVKLLQKINSYQNRLSNMKNWSKAIIINNGATFWPNRYISFLSQEKDGIGFIANLLKKANFDAINFSRQDFYTPFKILEKISNNKEIVKLPFVSSNLDCKNANTPICKIVKKDPIIIERDGINIAIISIVTKEVLTKASPENIVGINILTEAKEVNRLAAELKKSKKADIVILLSQIESSSTSPKKILELSKRIKNVDLIISNSRNIKMINRYQNNTTILGANPDSYNVNAVVVDIQDIGKKYIVETVEYRKFKIENSENKELTQKIDNFNKRYMDKYDIPINNMKIKKLSFDNFYKYLLKVMIEKTDSEIAIINKKALNNSIFPVDKMTYDTIEKAIKYNEIIVSFKMKGKLLKTFLTKNKTNLYYSNVDFTSKIKVNGRDIIPEKDYKITTIEYLANGGDGYFKGKFVIKNKKEIKPIKTALIEYLTQKEFLNSNSTWNFENFENLSDKFLWEFYNNLGLFYLKNDVENKDTYDKAKLATTPLESFRVNLLVKLIGSSKYNILENNFLIDYNQSDNNGVMEESKDIISYKLNYKNNYFKSTSNLFITPLPYIEIKLDSELTKADGADNRYYELYLSTGASFLTLKKKLEVKLGFLTSKDFTLEDNKFETGIVAGYSLSNYDIGFLNIPIKISSKLEYFKSFSDDINIIDFSFTNNIPLLGHFYLAIKFDSYMYKELDKDWSYSYNMLFGINMIYNDWF